MAQDENMRIQLCDIFIELKTDIPKVMADWKAIFVSHQPHSDHSQEPAIKIEACPLENAPLNDPKQPTTQFKSENGTYSLSTTILGKSKLTLASGAIICLPNLHQPYDKSRPIKSELYISPKLFNYGQVEDVTFTLLAPIMRRFGIYIVHAFGVTHPSQAKAVLIIGRSGQGKTTTGLSLIEEGWHYLGNDAIFLSQNSEGKIVAWFSPGQINLHPNSLPFLDTSGYLSKNIELDLDGKYHFSSQKLISKKQIPSEVTLQLFPKIVNQAGDCQIEALPASIALSQTMEQSVDHWDIITIEDHFSFLEQLATQTKNFKANNTTNLQSLSRVLLKQFSQ